MNYKINLRLFEDFMITHNITKSKFCKLCNIQVSTYNRIVANKNFKIVALFKISKVIKVHVCKMFND